MPGYLVSPARDNRPGSLSGVITVRVGFGPEPYSHGTYRSGFGVGLAPLDLRPWSPVGTSVTIDLDGTGSGNAMPGRGLWDLGDDNDQFR